jgi:hypothetical protein
MSASLFLDEGKSPCRVKGGAGSRPSRASRIVLREDSSNRRHARQLESFFGHAKRTVEADRGGQGEEGCAFIHPHELKKHITAVFTASRAHTKVIHELTRYFLVPGAVES